MHTLKFNTFLMCFFTVQLKTQYMLDIHQYILVICRIKDSVYAWYTPVCIGYLQDGLFIVKEILNSNFVIRSKKKRRQNL